MSQCCRRRAEGVGPPTGHHHPRMRTLLAAACAALTLLLTACAGPQESSAPAQTQPAAPAQPVVSPLPAATKERVRLYFPHRTDPVLVLEEREVERVGDQPEWVALTELFAGPRSEQARLVLPPEWKEQFSAPKVFDGDLQLFIGREAGEALQRAGVLAVYAIVNTLAQGERVKRVRFVLDRAGGSLVVDGVDITQPILPRSDLVRTTGR